MKHPILLLFNPIWDPFQTKYFYLLCDKKKPFFKELYCLLQSISCVEYSIIRWQVSHKYGTRTNLMMKGVPLNCMITLPPEMATLLLCQNIKINIVSTFAALPLAFCCDKIKFIFYQLKNLWNKIGFDNALNF